MSIKTSQVVLFFANDEQESVKDFAKMRERGSANSSFSAWYETYRENCFLFSSNGLGNLLSFTTSFNMKESKSQGMYTFQILDPTNKFEYDFFTHFYKGRSTVEAMDEMTSRIGHVDFDPARVNIKGGGDIAEFNPASSRPTQVETWLSNVREAANSFSSQPFTTPLYVSYGIGDDIKTWSPLVRVNLRNIDYSLSEGGVRVLTLSFVPNVGLGLLTDSDSKEHEYFKNNERTRPEAKVPFVVKDRDDLQYKNITNNALVLIANLLSIETKSTLIPILPSLKEALDGKFKVDLASAIKQQLDAGSVVFPNLQKKGERRSNAEVANEIASLIISGESFKIEGVVRSDAEQGSDLITSTKLSEKEKPKYLELRKDLIPITKEDTLNVLGATLKDKAWDLAEDAGEAVADTGLGGFVPKIIFTAREWAKEGLWKATEMFSSKAGVAGARALIDVTSREKTFFEVYQSKQNKLKKENIKKTSLVSLTINTDQELRLILLAAKMFCNRLGINLTRFKDSKPQSVGQGADGKDTDTPDKERAVGTWYLHKRLGKDESSLDLLRHVLKRLDKTEDVDYELFCLSEVKFVDAFKKILIESLDQGGEANLARAVALIQGQDNVTVVMDSTIKKYLSAYSDEGVKDLKVGEFSLIQAHRESLATEPRLLEGEGGFNHLFHNLTPDQLELSQTSDGITSDLSLLTSDEDLAGIGAKNIQEQLEEKFYPTFRYGFKDSNVLGFSFEMAQWFAWLLQIIPSSFMQGLISLKAKENEIIQDVLAKVTKIKTGEDLTKKIDNELNDWYTENIQQRQSDEELSNNISNLVSIGALNDALSTQTNTGFSFSESYSDSSTTRSIIPTREQFVASAKRVLKSILEAPAYAETMLIDEDTESSIFKKVASMRDSLSSKFFRGVITTLPIFNLCSPQNVTGFNKALLYFMEPEIFGNRLDVPKSTWLSGLYTILGYSVEISGSNVNTSFLIQKDIYNANV